MARIDQLKGMTQDELIAALLAKETAVKGVGRIRLQVGAKGGVSLYGLTARFPLTLYKSQWVKVIELVKDGTIEQFLADNAAMLSRKDADGNIVIGE